MPSTSVDFTVDVDLTPDTPVTSYSSFVDFTIDVELSPVVASIGYRRRVLVVKKNGRVLVELENATATGIKHEIGSHDECTVTLPITDRKLARVLDKKVREVQVWRGNRLEVWGPVGRPQVDANFVSLPVKGASWYFDRRFVGSSQIVNHVTNPDFTALANWRQLQSAYFLDYMPIGYGAVGVVTSPSRPGAHAAQMTIVYDFYHPGYGQVTIVQDHPVTTTAAGMTATLTCWMYVPSADFLSYGPDNQRGLTLARMPTDYRTNNFFTRTGGVNSWGGARGYYTDFLDVQVAAFTADDPFDTWIKKAVSIDLPPNVSETVTIGLGGIEGKTYWSKPRLTYNDGLEFVDVEQGAIIAGLVEHAQDPAFGKSDDNIDTSWTPAGVRRSLVAPFAEHANVWSTIQNYTTQDNGVDISMRYSTHKRTVVVSYPQLGNWQPKMVLATGRNVADFTWTWDGEAAANTEIMLGAGNATDREEAGATDTSSYAEGTVLEAVQTATPETDDDDLIHLAEGHLLYDVDPEVLQVTTDAGAGLVDRLMLGDSMPVNLVKGLFRVLGNYRCVSLTINDDDSLDLTLNKVPA